MKTSFTRLLKYKWRHLLPIVFFSAFSYTQLHAACPEKIQDFGLTLDCEARLNITAPAGVTGLKIIISNAEFDLPINHATNVLAPGQPFKLKFLCSDPGKSAALLDATFVNYNFSTGAGSGTYKFNASGVPLLQAGTAGSGGTVNLVVTNKLRPTCPGAMDGQMWVQVVGNNLVDKCKTSTFSITLGGVTINNVSVGGVAKFTGLSAGTYTAAITETTYSCPCPLTRNPVTDILLNPALGTVSIACIDQINVSVSPNCTAHIDYRDILLGAYDPCGPAPMIDEFYVYAGNVLVGSGSAMSPVVTFDASDYLDQKLKVEIRDTDSGNWCWGSALIEDKSPPIITCNDGAPKEILCLDFAGNLMAELDNRVTDCSGVASITIIRQETNEDCPPRPTPGTTASSTFHQILKRITFTYFATDTKGLRSETCTDEITIMRFDPIYGNGILDLPGTLIMPPNFIVNPGANDRAPIDCDDQRIVYQDADRCRPAPIGLAAGGTMFPRLRYMSDGIEKIADLFPANYPTPSQAQAQLVRQMIEGCKIAVDYQDQVFNFGCKKKVLRTWFLREWSCEGEQTLMLGVQEIVITDIVAPTFVTRVPDLTFSVDAFSCSRTVDIPRPTLADNCARVQDLQLKYFVYDEDWNLIGPDVAAAASFRFTFPYGNYRIVYVAEDPCDNARRDTAEISIIDQTPPVVICKEFLVVGLSADGLVRVPAAAFDNGSYDDCGIESRCVVRMDDLDLLESLDTDRDGEVLFSVFNNAMVACGRDYSEYAYRKADGLYYINRDVICTPYVVFCCANNTSGNDNIMIQFRARDIHGNVNQCMIFVDLQDKSIPTVTCPSSITVDCRLPIPTFDAIKDRWVPASQDLLSGLFGSVVAQNEQKAFGLPGKYLISTGNFVDGTFFDNCGAPRIEVYTTGGVDNCGLGVIRRRFRAIDVDGNISNTCEQVITVDRIHILDNRAFTFVPRDTLINDGCRDPRELADESFGEPRVDDESCSLLGLSVENQIFYFNTLDPNSDACFKIVRTFTLIDWCRQADPNSSGFILDRHVQIIKVNDPEGPTITCGSNVTEQTDDCTNARVTLTASATDECTQGSDLQWTARIDVDTNNDGSFDNSFIVSLSQNGNTVSHTGSYPIGRHRITFTVRDRCGNESTCEQHFTIVNTKRPTPVAVDLRTVIMPVVGMVEIWANDFERSSFHPCVPRDSLMFFITRANESFAERVTSMNFTCANLTAQERANGVNLKFFVAYRSLNGELISAFTNVNLRIQDNTGVCNNTGTNAFIAGNVHTEMLENIPNISVELKGGENQGASAIESAMTNERGDYAFAGMPMGGKYMIDPQSSDRYLNGVSTLDLVLIQRYILGMYEMQSPYRLIAADVNKDGQISAVDLVELRSVILGHKEGFTNNTSWRFIDAAYVFDDPKRPLESTFPESYRIDALNSNMTVDFIGIKVGDIDGSASAAGVISRPRSSYSLTTVDQNIKSGEIVKVDLAASRVMNTVGTQFTINFDPQAMSFVGIGGEKMSLSPYHINADQAAKGLITISWNNVDGIELNAGDVLMSLTFDARRSVSLRSVIDITSDITTAEIYSSELETQALSLAFSRAITEATFALYQNTPNPFADYTEITFQLPSAGWATLTVGDVTGKVVKIIKGEFAKGINNIRLDKSDLADPGLYFYTLETEGHFDTKRMVVLK